VTSDVALVADLRSEVLAALSEKERALSDGGRPGLGTGDEQALGRQLIAEALERRAERLSPSGPRSCPLRKRMTWPRRPLTRCSAWTGCRGCWTIPRSRTSTPTALTSCGSATRMGDGNESADRELERRAGGDVAHRCGPHGDRRAPFRPRLAQLVVADARRLAPVCPHGACRPAMRVDPPAPLPARDADDLIKKGTLDLALREFLRAAMRARKSCIICGGIGAGKTTLLRAMAADIPPTERLITIEDSLELGLERFPSCTLTSSPSRPANPTWRVRAG